MGNAIRPTRHDLNVTMLSMDKVQEMRFSDCTAGKTYPAEIVLPGQLCADGVLANSIAISFIDDAGMCLLLTTRLIANGCWFNVQLSDALKASHVLADAAVTLGRKWRKRK